MKKAIIFIESVIEFISKVIFKSQRILGLILLIPPILSVYAFMFGNDLSEYVNGNIWTGDYYAHYDISFEPIKAEGSGGYTSAFPFYLGIMAIAGSYLIKGNNK